MLVVKQINLLSFGSTCSEIFIVSSMLGITLLQAYYNENVAKQATYISFAAAIFYMLVTQLHLLYLPNSYDVTQIHFAAIFAFAPKIVITSILVYFLAQRINIILYKLIDKLFKNMHISLKSFITGIITQIFDTILFANLALSNIVGSLTSVIMISIGIKLIVLLISVPLLKLSTKYIHKTNVQV